VFLDEKEETQQQQQNKQSKLNTLPEPGIETGISRTQSGCVTSAPTSQLRVTIV